MKAIAYPADEYGCGHHRMIWPCEVLQQQGLDVTVVASEDRQVRMMFNQANELVNVEIPDDVDVVVLQRCTDRRLVQMVRWLVDRHYAVVVDVDDDLHAIHPSNPAFTFLDPNRADRETREAVRNGQAKPEQAGQLNHLLKQKYTHSWHNLAEVCKYATLVTVSTPGLLKRYAAHGRGMVIPNYVPEHYLRVGHDDSDLLGWPAALHSHPNDPSAVGNALARLVGEGVKFRTIGESVGVTAAFGLPLRTEDGELLDPPGGDVTLQQWPWELAQLGVGIVPLADTLFNSRKSWLKGLELSAVGVPWVASPRAAYQKLHDEYGAGVLAEKPRQWYQALRRLLDEPTYRADVAAAGREAAKRLRMVDHAWRYAEAWADARDLADGRQVAALRASQSVDV
jgi:hypothetical protein